jgi:hypothetical protein
VRASVSTILQHVTSLHSRSSVVQGLLSDLLTSVVTSGPATSTAVYSKVQLFVRNIGLQQGTVLLGCTLLYAEGRLLFPAPETLAPSSPAQLLALATASVTVDPLTNNRLRDISAEDWNATAFRGTGVTVRVYDATRALVNALKLSPAFDLAHAQVRGHGSVYGGVYSSCTRMNAVCCLSSNVLSRAR